MVLGYIYYSRLTPENLRLFILSFGIFSPIVMILVMIVAVIIAPIPSVPIDLISGGIFGGFLGGIYSLIGAELGAIAAFLIARKFGKNVVNMFAKDFVDVCDDCPEEHLFYLVLISRLIPIINFDVVSNAAGMTKLSLSKFATATAIGMLPVTFLLTYTGNAFFEGTFWLNVILTMFIVLTFYLIPKYMKKKNIRFGKLKINK